MCEFLRRPGDYTQTSSSGYMRDVIVDSSFSGVKVTYSHPPTSNTLPLCALQTYMSTHLEEIAALEQTNPELYALLSQLTYGDGDGF
jgi:hypothetical protein